MSHPSQKSAGIQHFQIGDDETYDHDGIYDHTKTNAADRKDMYRMGKPQEMRVSIVLSREVDAMAADALNYNSVTSRQSPCSASVSF